MTQQGPQLCPHRANPKACPMCFNAPKKAVQPAQRTSLDPVIDKGKVVNPKTDLVAQAMAARKAAAMESAEARIAGKPALAASRAAPLPPAPQQPVSNVNNGNPNRRDHNPHAGGAMPDETPQGEPGQVFIDIAALEREFPKHESIIDRQPTHPEGHVSSKGTIIPGRGGAGSRPPVTKGRRPG